MVGHHTTTGAYLAKKGALRSQSGVLEEHGSANQFGYFPIDSQESLPPRGDPFPPMGAMYDQPYFPQLDSRESLPPYSGPLADIVRTHGRYSEVAMPSPREYLLPSSQSGGEGRSETVSPDRALLLRACQPVQGPFRSHSSNVYSQMLAEVPRPSDEAGPLPRMLPEGAHTWCGHVETSRAPLRSPLNDVFQPFLAEGAALTPEQEQGVSKAMKDFAKVCHGGVHSTDARACDKMTTDFFRALAEKTSEVLGAATGEITHAGLQVAASLGAAAVATYDGVGQGADRLQQGCTGAAQGLTDQLVTWGKQCMGFTRVATETVGTVSKEAERSCTYTSKEAARSCGYALSLVAGASADAAHGTMKVTSDALYGLDRAGGEALNLAITSMAAVAGGVAGVVSGTAEGLSRTTTLPTDDLHGMQLAMCRIDSAIGRNQNDVSQVAANTYAASALGVIAVTTAMGGPAVGALTGAGFVAGRAASGLPTRALTQAFGSWEVKRDPALYSLNRRASPPVGFTLSEGTEMLMSGVPVHALAMGATGAVTGTYGAITRGMQGAESWAKQVETPPYGRTCSGMISRQCGSRPLL